jgi:putative DNA primase/helicase
MPRKTIYDTLKAEMGLANGHSGPSKPRGRRAEVTVSADGQQPPTVVEAADDPHRLGRLHLGSHCDTDGRLLLRYWNEQFLRWESGAYRAHTDSDVKAEVVKGAKQEFDRLANAQAELLVNAAGVGDANDRPKPVVTRKVTATVANNVMQAIRSESLLPATVMPPCWLNDPARDATNFFACRNAVLDLPALADGRPDAVLAPTPRLFTLSAADMDFDPVAPPPGLFLRFLAELWGTDAESIDTLGEMLGYLLTADTSQQKIFLIVGPPRSGKGTIGRLIRLLLGDENVAGPTLSGLGTNFGLWPLIGKPCAIVSDARLDRRADLAVIAERLLSISGEDGQTIDRKNLPPVTMKLPTRFVILTNELPRIADASGAIASRFIVLKLLESFYGREDKDLTAKLVNELPSILLWAVAGWKRLRDRGHFVQPKSALADVQELADLASPMKVFLRECCDVGHGRQVERATLFDRWRRWCSEQGRDHAGDAITFGRNLRAAVPMLRDAQPRTDFGGRVRVYDGVAIK